LYSNGKIGLQQFLVESCQTVKRLKDRKKKEKEEERRRKKK
jgi:hypothetical protein